MKGTMNNVKMKGTLNVKMKGTMNNAKMQGTLNVKIERNLECKDEKNHE